MNLLAASFLAQVGARYDLFQVAFTFLNLLVFFPLLAHCPPPWRRRAVPVRISLTILLCLFAASPVLTQNAARSPGPRASPTST